MDMLEEYWDEWSAGLDTRVKEEGIGAAQSVQLDDVDLRKVSNHTLATLFSSMKSIEINGTNISPAGWDSCTEAIVAKRKAGEGILQALKLWSVDLTKVFNHTLATLFSSMKSIDIDGATKISSAGWDSCTEAIVAKHKAGEGILHDLKLWSVDLTKVSNQTLATLFSSMKSIGIDGGTKISPAGWDCCTEAIVAKHKAGARILQDLKLWSVDLTEVSNHTLATLFSSMKSIDIDGSTNISPAGWDCCTKAAVAKYNAGEGILQDLKLWSVDLTKVSNHTLAKLFSYMKCIEIGWSTNISPAGWDSCAESIVAKYNGGEGILQVLKLWSVDLTMVSNHTLATLFSSMKIIEIGRTTKISPAGWDSCTEVIVAKHNAGEGILQDLKLWSVNLMKVSNHTLATLFSSMKTIQIYGFTKISPAGWDSFTKAVEAKYNADEGCLRHIDVSSYSDKDKYKKYIDKIKQHLVDVQNDSSESSMH